MGGGRPPPVSAVDPPPKSGVRPLLRWYPGFSTGFLKDDGVAGARFPSDARQRPQLAE